MRRYITKILLVLVIATLLFVWGNSLLPADLSSMESGRVEKLLAPVLAFLQSGQLQQWLTTMGARLASAIEKAVQALCTGLDRLLALGSTVLVRKAAHFSEYMLLGFLMALLFARKRSWSRFLLPEGCSLAAALVDEGIQLFSHGRSAQLRDVCIDLSGATLGIFLGLLFLALLRGVRALVRKMKKVP